MTKIDIISGFLGAGKTTLIKKLLEEVFKGEKVVLIENEYGEVGIDGGFLKDSGITVTEMNSGCICCSLVGDFTKNMGEVVEKFHPDRILVEPSGVGKLSDVMASVADVSKTVDVTLNALVTVVNGKKALKQMKAFGEFFNNQVEYATTIVLSRTQDMDDAKLQECVKVLQEKNPKAAIITTPWDELSGDVILKAVEQKASLKDEILHEVEHEHEHHHHDHDHEHHHDEDGHCCCGHDHDHDHEHEHEHHHDHEHEHEHHHDHDHDHDHHEHHYDENGVCSCGHHHEHGHHHADDVFISWGIETPHKFDRATVEKALDTLCHSEKYESTILRAKGMVPSTDGTWIYFDMVPGDYELREGAPDYTGRLVVIGTNVEEEEMKTLFGM
ncbi:MAG: GTP-binding protein [Lachnospiraceae bacterium]|jgi:G3E family GTPase|nr:GTP-binding protein [Lachnospiraceae bacterium]